MRSFSSSWWGGVYSAHRNGISFLEKMCCALNMNKVRYLNVTDMGNGPNTVTDTVTEMHLWC